MTAPHSADQPIDDLDQAILDHLAVVLTRLDPPPTDLDDRVRLVLALDDLDREVARLRDEQLVGGVRGTERTRTLTFDAESRTVMITIVDRPDGLVRIDGWLAPGAAVRVELRHPAPGPAQVVQSDASGRFVLDGVPHGLAQLIVHPAPGEHAPQVVTPALGL
ncbi:hypothetical protein [Plantactinospora sp. KBS50]|uniref:hypothetical protein n=1 Tax=Plantactinospora sp. KBS50 TaxID=2024580 RepID=UPI0012FD7356|nr:hypothetical protein [Plantactinospora sp. KBS50]